MKRFLAVFASACLFAASAFGQQTVDNSGAVRVSPYPIVYAFPGGCTYGDVVTYALGTPGSNTYICGATHNWVQLAGGSGGSASSGTGIAVVVSGVVGAAIAQPVGTVVGTTDTQTLTNKSIAGSEVNSGTLPHAQLPTLLSGDIPNNAANTSGLAGTASALASTPSLCPTGQSPTGVLPNGNATGCAVSTGIIGIESTETMSFTLSCSADNLYIIPISGSGITATIPSGCAQGTTFIPVNVGSSNVTVNFSANSQTYDENGTTNNAAKILSPCTTAPCTGPSITMGPSGTNWLLKNSQGAAGATGATGATGPTGSTGATGATGATGGAGAINPACTFVATNTGCTTPGSSIDVSSLNIPTANSTSILLQCFTQATGTSTALAATYTVTTGSGIVQTVIPLFGAAASGGYCAVNASGSAGPAGATGPIGATGATGSSGGGTTINVTGSGYWLPFGDVAFQTAGGAFTANDNVLWQTVCCTGGATITANNVAYYVFTGEASSHMAAAIYKNAGLSTGTYTSGITAVGTATQTCLLTLFNGGISTGATATIALTGTNAIAGGTALTITSAGFGATSAPTSATVGNGTATCSGTPVLAMVVGAGDLIVQASTGNVTTSAGRQESTLSSATTLTPGIYWIAMSGDVTSLALAEEGTATANLALVLNESSYPRQAKCANTVSWSTGTPTFPAICGAFSNLASHRIPQMAVLP